MFVSFAAAFIFPAVVTYMMERDYPKMPKKEFEEFYGPFTEGIHSKTKLQRNYLVLVYMRKLVLAGTATYFTNHPGFAISCNGVFSCVMLAVQGYSFPYEKQF